MLLTNMHHESLGAAQQNLINLLKPSWATIIRIGNIERISIRIKIAHQDHLCLAAWSGGLQLQNIAVHGTIHGEDEVKCTKILRLELPRQSRECDAMGRGSRPHASIGPLARMVP